jgi:type II secretory pathway predicted ATPase ExeA
MLENFVEDSRHSRMKNLLKEAFASPVSMPKVIVVTAEAGCGKSTLLRRLCAELGWVFFSLKEYQSPAWLMGSLAAEVCGYSLRSISENYSAVVGSLRKRPRGIICDEAHRVARNLSRYEVLRDVSDEAGVPLVLVGTSDLLRAVHALPPLESRVAGWGMISPCDLADTKLYSEQLCEVALADDLIAAVHELTNGLPRGIVIALSRLESLAHRRGKKRLSLADIPERFSFTFATRNRRHAIATDDGAMNETAPALKVVG